MIFRPISPDEARPVIAKWHYIPSMPSNPDYCFGAEDNGMIVWAGVFVRCNNSKGFPVLEAITHAKDPSSKLQSSQAMTKSCKYLKSKGEHLIITFCEVRMSTGTLYKASHWNFSGMANMPPDSRIEAVFSDAGDYYFFWKALTPEGQDYAQQFNLKTLPYLNAS